jgi:hypothetical protein
MANEILTSTLALAADMVSDALGPAIANKVVCLQHVFAENIPVLTTKKQARKDGAMGLGTVTGEAAAYSFGSAGEINQLKVELTIAKTVIGSKLTVEAEEFGQMDLATVTNKQANALSRTLDNAVKALATGFSQNVDAGSAMDAESLMDAGYLITAGNHESDGQRKVAILDPKQVNQIKKQLVQTGGSAFSNLELLSVLTTLDTANGYAGTLPGVDVYQVNGLPTGTGKRSGMVINPDLAFFGMYGSAPVTWIIPNGAGGVYYEVFSYIWNQVAEWYDGAGIEVKSDQ